MDCIYPDDLTEAELSIIIDYLPDRSQNTAGCKPKWSWCAILNGIFYILRTGAAWRHLPKDYPPWKTVYHYFRQWQKDDLWAIIQADLLKMDRVRQGRNEEPSIGIIDSQSVKTTDIIGEHGYDAGKKINGRKRHIITDITGAILGVSIHTADIQDRDGAKQLIEETVLFYPTIQVIFADGGYRGKLEEWVAENCNRILSIVKKPEDLKGFVLLPKRWVVERSFAWLTKYRRMSKDYERSTSSSCAMVLLAQIRMLLKRLAK